MKFLSLAALLIVASAMNVNAQSRKDGSFWIPVDVKWSRIPGAPRDVRKRTASTTVLYFGNDGEFVRDECWLIRDGKSILISNGDPHNQYVGRITGVLDGMRMTYRLVRRTVQKNGEVLPGPEISVSASTMAKSGLAMGGRFFHGVELGNASEYAEAYSALGQLYPQKLGEN